ncbi:GDSL-like Lipase/Acylhydrolase-domain-containing protein [Mycotypha africana]|uniref:GDSL-like Lipase/Acylhydrolase-domain-containing protein n=1 Tax=Mycotypha africana TaxID=64632 RepID=UPI0023014BB2|nr:GDSL-like Lipase/Acylhydrolase-domain-containing protein [Mycotypha africana]KAI8977164.1 GDSL-like Lipase/Acylhydrolase-domain-containing protein [Mycotypha africana]
MNDFGEDRRTGGETSIKAAAVFHPTTALAYHRKHIMYFFTLLATVSCCLLYFNFALPALLPLRPKTPFQYDKINTLISFGDSYTTRYLDMDSLTYACRTCTSAGGPNWVIYLTDETQWISWDFAYNSAPVNNSIVHQVPTVIDVSTQMHNLYPSLFVTPTDKIASIVSDVYKDQKRTADSTLVTIWVGINDIRLTYTWDDIDTLDATIMKKYEGLIEELMQEGETQFMMMNMPPLDRAPLWHSTDDQVRIQERVKEFNKKLNDMIERLRTNHPNCDLFEYDAWTVFTDMLNHPGDYGMTDVDNYCPDWSHPTERGCKPIEQYFWLNDLHPTYHVHDYLAKHIRQYLIIQSSSAATDAKVQHFHKATGYLM